MPTVEQIMEAAAAAAAAAAGSGHGPHEVHEMSGGPSEIGKVSELSAFSAPPKARRRGADEMSGASSSIAGSQAGSRPPSPAPATRLVHRRVEPTSDTYPGRLKQLEEQHEADREMIDCLKGALIELQGKMSSQDLAIAKLRRTDELAAKRLLETEAALLTRIDDNKKYLMKESDEKVDKVRVHVLNGIHEELTSKELFTKHLVGHDGPVLEPLVGKLLHAKFAELDQKFAILNAWVASRTLRDGKVETYLQELHTARPQEGKTVETAFLSVAQELLEIRAAAGAATGAQRATGAGGEGGGAGGSGANDAAFHELCGQVSFLRENILQGKCHCKHVDAHETRLDGIEGRQKAVDNSLKLLEAAARQTQRPAASPAAAPPRPASGG